MFSSFAGITSSTSANSLKLLKHYKNNMSNPKAGKKGAPENAAAALDPKTTTVGTDAAAVSKAAAAQSIINETPAIRGRGGSLGGTAAATEAGSHLAQSAKRHVDQSGNTLGFTPDPNRKLDANQTCTDASQATPTVAVRLPPQTEYQVSAAAAASSAGGSGGAAAAAATGGGASAATATHWEAFETAAPTEIANAIFRASNNLDNARAKRIVITKTERLQALINIIVIAVLGAGQLLVGDLATFHAARTVGTPVSLGVAILAELVLDEVLNCVPGARFMCAASRTSVPGRDLLWLCNPVAVTNAVLAAAAAPRIPTFGDHFVGMLGRWCGKIAHNIVFFSAEMIEFAVVETQHTSSAYGPSVLMTVRVGDTTTNLKCFLSPSHFAGRDIDVVAARFSRFAVVRAADFNGQPSYQLKIFKLHSVVELAWAEAPNPSCGLDFE
jgi:hypothetical protein